MSITPEPVTQSESSRVWEQCILYMHGYCLDAPLVACVWSCVFVSMNFLPMKWGDISMLSITIWLGYVIDRWLDVRRYPNQHNLSFRHALIKQYQKALAAIGLLFCMLGLFLMIQDYHGCVVLNGTMSLMLVIIYSGWVYFSPTRARRLFPRELAVAFFFTLATIVMPLSRSESLASISNLIPFIFLMITCCWLNLCSISSWESSMDAQQNEFSITQLIPEHVELNLLNTIFCLGIITLTMIFYQGVISLGRCCLMIVTSTYMLNYLSLKPETKSALADITMVLPVLLLLP